MKYLTLAILALVFIGASCKQGTDPEENPCDQNRKIETDAANSHNVTEHAEVVTNEARKDCEPIVTIDYRFLDDVLHHLSITDNKSPRILWNFGTVGSFGYIYRNSGVTDPAAKLVEITPGSFVWRRTAQGGAKDRTDVDFVLYDVSAQIPPNVSEDSALSIKISVDYKQY